MKIKFPYELVYAQDESAEPPLFKVGFVDKSSGCVITDPHLSSCGRFHVGPAQYGLTEAEASTLGTLNSTITRAIEAALNEACLKLQEEMGVEQGDAAAIYFSGDLFMETVGVPFSEMLAGYIAFEFNSSKE